jgi:hypothetical protein
MVDSKTLLDIDRLYIALIDAKAHYPQKLGAQAAPSMWKSPHSPSTARNVPNQTAAQKLSR